MQKKMVEIKQCSTDADFSYAMRITKDYIAWLGMDLSFQGIDEELSGFASMFGPPDGFFLLAWHDGELAGGVGLRKLAAGVCEMKHLFVYERFRGGGIGRSLCTELIERARRMPYGRMRLDTLDRMKAAIRLYESVGFRDIGPYRFNPDPTARYMELRLR